MDGIIAVCLTLTDVIEHIKKDLSLSPARRRDLVSAVLRVCELAGVDPQVTPASLPYMRPLIKKVRPARHNIQPKTWSNLRANFRAAVVAPLPRKPREQNPEWDTLLRAIPVAWMRERLSGLRAYCQGEGIAPTKVSDAVLRDYEDYLEKNSLVWDPRRCAQSACTTWNAALGTVPGWPQARLHGPSRRTPRRTLPLTSYPPSLQEEINRCLAPPRPENRFALDGHWKVLRASTVEKIRTYIGLALSALVDAGKPPETMRSLRCLLEPEAYETIIRRYLKDDDEQTPTPTAHNIASTLIGLADRYFGPDHADRALIAELRRLRKCLGAKPTGLTKKNRRLLLELSDLHLRAKLYELPDRLAAWAGRTTPAQGALAMQLAVAIAILLVAPIRISNLAALRFDRHLLRPDRPRSLWLIDIPEDEVKNRVRLVHELPHRVTTLLDRFRRDFRPRIAEPGNPYLFPVGSHHKSAVVLSQAIKRRIADWVGIHMTPHQFRHLAGLLMYDDLEALAQLLGDKSTRTVRNHYSELNTLEIGRRFDAIIQSELDGRRRARRTR
jgi:integrase